MNEGNLIVLLLLSLLAAVLIVGLVLVVLAIRWRRTGRWWQKDACSPNPASSGHPSSPKTGLPRTWLALRTTDHLAVQRAFALDDPQPCTWTDGLTDEAPRRLFVSPPVAGWILVTGSELPEPSGDIDACFRFLMKLSRQLGHVQYFHQDCHWQHHAWVRLDAGRVLRAYAWVEQAVWNQGATTAAEQELCLRLYEYGDEPAPPNGIPGSEVQANLERLPQLAARWSIDPTSVGARFWSAHPGISGEFTALRLL